jgi:uncharacterized membrane protein
MNMAPRLRLPLDLLPVVLLGALTTLAVVAFPHVVALRATFGLPFLLLGPGYALMRALFARDRLEASMRVLLALALSIATIVLVSLALNAAQIALTARSLAVAVLITTAVACLVTAVRDRHLPETIPLAPLRVPQAPSRVLRSPWLWSVSTLIAVFAGLLVLLARPLPDGAFAGYTQLSALRSGAGGVRVEVQSAEHLRTTYRLDVTTAAGRSLSRTLTLAPGQQWKRIIDAGRPAEQTVNIRLYRTAAPAAVYRELTLRA